MIKYCSTCERNTKHSFLYVRKEDCPSYELLMTSSESKEEIEKDLEEEFETTICLVCKSDSEPDNFDSSYYTY